MGRSGCHAPERPQRRHRFPIALHIGMDGILALKLFDLQFVAVPQLHVRLHRDLIYTTELDLAQRAPDSIAPVVSDPVSITMCLQKLRPAPPHAGDPPQERTGTAVARAWLPTLRLEPQSLSADPPEYIVASFCVSRRSVLVLSPERRGMDNGAITSPCTTSPRRKRQRSKPHEEAS